MTEFCRSDKEDDRSATEFCVCAKNGRIKLCVVTPFGNLPVMDMDRKTFADLREKVNACHGRMLAGEVPECVRRAFEENDMTQQGGDK